MSGEPALSSPEPAAEPPAPATDPSPEPAAEHASGDEPIAGAAVPTPPRRSRTPLAIAIAAIVLLAVVAGLLGWLVIRTQQQLDDADDRISELERQIQEQQELIDRKETFGAAMDELMGTAREFDGALMASLVPLEQYRADAARGWARRDSARAMDEVIAEVHDAKSALDELLASATEQASTNATGTTYEAVIDRLGGGFASSVLDDADALCGRDVLACVTSNDPYTVHFDAADAAAPYMTDWIRTGLAYHEFAHVLQYTNPGPTDTALAAFDGDVETMADCFALTYLDGWTLDHRVWTGAYQYWDVSVGYGYTCDESQRQTVRDWYGQLGVHVSPISQ